MKQHINTTFRNGVLTEVPSLCLSICLTRAEFVFPFHTSEKKQGHNECIHFLSNNTTMSDLTELI